MNRQELEAYIVETYIQKNDFPWQKYPGYHVFRHMGNQKWFAVVMDIPSSKLGIEGNEVIDVVNLKCDAVLIGSLLIQDGFYPAYHMAKTKWITVALDGTAPDEDIKLVLDMSYELTAPKVKKSKIK